MAQGNALPQALSAEQLQTYLNSNFGEFSQAYNQNDWGYSSLDDFAKAHYTTHGRGEIESGSRSNPFAQPEPVPAAAPAPVPAGQTAATAPVDYSGLLAQYTNPPAPPEVQQPQFSPQDYAAAMTPVMQGILSSIEANRPQAETYEAKEIEIDPSKTTQGLISSLISEDSPYIQQAKSQALEEMNSRGLLNSSLSGAAAAGAAIDRAGQIAVEDSRMWLQAQLANQSAVNSARQFNAGAINQFGLAGYEGALNMGSRLFDSVARNQEQTLAATQDMMKLKYGADLELNKMAFGAEIDMGRLAQMQAYDLEKLGVANAMDLEKMRIGQGLDLEKLAVANRYDTDKMAIANDYEMARLIKASDLDLNNRTALAAIAFQYGEMGKQSAFANSLIATTLTTLNQIMADPEISNEPGPNGEPSPKQQLSSQALVNFHNSLRSTGQVNVYDYGGTFEPWTEDMLEPFYKALDDSRIDALSGQVSDLANQFANSQTQTQSVSRVLDRDWDRLMDNVAGEAGDGGVGGYAEAADGTGGMVG